MDLFIDHYSRKGFGVGKSALEVKGALLEEQVEIVQKKKKRGELVCIKRSSSSRVVPRCKHALECGGCVWQEMDYKAQLSTKEKIVREIYSSFLNNDDVIFHPIIPSFKIFAYRNKMEFSFSEDKQGNRFLGLILSGSKGRVFNIEECHLGTGWFNRAREAIRRWWEKSSLHAYHRFKDTGSLRTLTLRQSARTQDKMAILTVSGNPDYALTKSQIDTFCKAMQEGEENVSLFLQIQQIAKGSPTQFYEMHLSGEDHLKEELHLSRHHRLTFKISPSAFFQPNTLQAEQLFVKALEMVGGVPLDTVLDLYCGTGTLGLIFAKRAKRVIGIELNPHAVFDAKANCSLNQINNVEFIQGDVSQVLKQLSVNSPDLVLLDPPRAGLDLKAIEQLTLIRPKKILYISCNPYTQVENIKNLVNNGFKLLSLQTVDQFPHTIQIENMALLSLNA